HSLRAAPAAFFAIWEMSARHSDGKVVWNRSRLIPRSAPRPPSGRCGPVAPSAAIADGPSVARPFRTEIAGRRNSGGGVAVSLLPGRHGCADRLSFPRCFACGGGAHGRSVPHVGPSRRLVVPP